MQNGKIEKLREWFLPLKGTVTAFSGGVDSSLVLYLSKKFIPKHTVASISISPSLKRKDYQLARDFCKQYDIKLEVIETKEIEDENYYTNPSNRCFFCKTHLYQDLQKVKEKFPGYTILNGINKDDFGDYRPGIKAARDHEIRSPLSDCGLKKEDIRELARYFGLPNWDKPASPCLSSRVPYGHHINEEKLSQIESAEEILNGYGFQDVRVRHYDREARIEVPDKMLEKLREKFDRISSEIQNLGFERCIIDEEGLVSGKLNRSLQLQHGR